MGELNRFAVGMLSRIYKSDAINEEMMTHKYSGQVLIKTPDGDIISHDALSRHKEHIDDVTNRAQLVGITGDLFSIDLDGLEMPEIVSENKNLLATDLILKSANSTKILLSVDLDHILMSKSNIISEFEPTVTVVVVYKKSDVETPITITRPISQLNSFILDSSKYVPDKSKQNEYSVTLRSLTIKRNANYPDNQLIRNILHGVLVVVE